jgi:Uma2 family endonuclease
MEAAIVHHDVTEPDVTELGATEHAITVDEFERMVAAGAFDDRRVELIDGRLIDMPPPDPPHDGTISAFQYTLLERLDRRALARAQMALRVAGTSVPVPDLAVVRWNDDFYRYRRPRTDETFAIVEVSNTSLAFDRDVKCRIYGAARIPEYWIADVRNKRIHVHREPHDLGYGTEEIRERDDTVSFAAFPDVVLSVAQLVG